MAEILSLNIFRIVTILNGQATSSIIDTTGYDFVGIQKGNDALGVVFGVNGSFDSTIAPNLILDSQGTAVAFLGLSATTAQTAILQQTKEVRAMNQMSITSGSAVAAGPPPSITVTNQTSDVKIRVGLRYIT